MTIKKSNKNLTKISFNNKNIRRVYKGKQLVYVTKVQTTENKTFNVAGTYSFTLPKELLSLTITVVGAGGGSGESTFYHGNKWCGRSGGSGAVCKSVFTGTAAKDLSLQSLTCIVGKAGACAAGAAAGGPTSAGGHKGADGGTSSCVGTNINMQATGGQGGMSGWYENGHAANGGTATGGNSLNKNGYTVPYGSVSVFAPTPSAYDDTTTGYGAGGFEPGYGAAYTNGIVGCVILDFTYMKSTG